jgi:MYXO-CTERM domain-containing protein
LTVSDPQSQGTAVSLKNYYLELRTAGGNFDAYGTASRPGAVTFTQPTVFVYTSDDVRVPTGAATTRNNQNSVWTELLNMTPSNSSFTGLTSVGQSFVDPAGGPTITLQAISATGATIAITNPKGSGSPTCIDGTALSGAGPTTCGAGEGGTGGTGGAGTGGTSGTGGVGGMATGGRATGGVPTGGAGGSKNGTGGGSSTGGAHTGGNVTAGGAAGHATTGGAPATGGRAGGTDAGINDNSTPPNGQLPGPSEIVGGCDCDTAPSAGSSSTGLALAAAVLLCLKRRRRETETCRARVRRPRGSRRIPSC